jgi:hypothetical protein
MKKESAGLLEDRNKPIALERARRPPTLYPSQHITFPPAASMRLVSSSTSGCTTMNRMLCGHNIIPNDETLGRKPSAVRKKQTLLTENY